MEAEEGHVNFLVNTSLTAAILVTFTQEHQYIDTDRGLTWFLGWLSVFFLRRRVSSPPSSLITVPITFMRLLVYVRHKLHSTDKLTGSPDLTPGHVGDM